MDLKYIVVQIQANKFTEGASGITCELTLPEENSVKTNILKESEMLIFFHCPLVWTMDLHHKRDTIKTLKTTDKLVNVNQKKTNLSSQGRQLVAYNQPKRSLYNLVYF